MSFSLKSICSEPVYRTKQFIVDHSFATAAVAVAAAGVFSGAIPVLFQSSLGQIAVSIIQKHALPACIMGGVTAIIKRMTKTPPQMASEPILPPDTFFSHSPYQPVLYKGSALSETRVYRGSGANEVIEQRYQTVKAVLDKYEGRPIKILDIGANNGYFSFSAARDFPNSTVVMAEGRPYLKSICEINQVKNIVCLEKRFTSEDLEELAKREHFDVVLCLHVLHHQTDWEKWVPALKKLGDQVIIETPPLDDPSVAEPGAEARKKPVFEYISSLPDSVNLGSFRRTLVEGKTNPSKMVWFCRDPEVFNKGAEQLGIDKTTFLDFGGVFPEPENNRNDFRQ